MQNIPPPPSNRPTAFEVHYRKVSKLVHAHCECVVAQRKFQVVQGNSLKVLFPDDATLGLFTAAAASVAIIGSIKKFFPFLPSWAYGQGWPQTPSSFTWACHARPFYALIWPFQGWLAHSMGSLRPSFTPLNSPCRKPIPSIVH
jgi:hypothetical protein